MNRDQEEGEKESGRSDRRQKKGGQSNTRLRKAQSYKEKGQRRGKTKGRDEGTWSLIGRKVMKGGRRAGAEWRSGR